MKELVFENVYGYQEVKNELNQIASWYKDDDILQNQKISLPKGVLFYGDPGNGKTLLVRQFINNFDVPKFVIEGKSKDTSLEIKKVFDKAKKEKFAIIVIDELELLISEDSKEQRILQQELDGIVQKGSILVLATVNKLYKVGAPLLRPGRFDRLISIDNPNRDSRKEIFKQMLLDLNIDINEINFDHIAKHCTNISGATIKAICNDVYLRNKNKVIIDEEIELSYERIEYDDLGKIPSTINDYRIAIHEAGHTLLTLHYKENWCFYKAKFSHCGGTTESKEVKEDYWTYDKKIQLIHILLGGYYAEEIIFKNHESGSKNDVERAHELCRELIEVDCLNGLKYHITNADEDINRKHRESVYKNMQIQKKTYKLMFKYAKIVKKYLNKHKSDLEIIAKFIYDNNKITYKDVERLGIVNV